MNNKYISKEILILKENQKNFDLPPKILFSLKKKGYFETVLNFIHFKNYKFNKKIKFLCVFVIITKKDIWPTFTLLIQI